MDLLLGLYRCGQLIPLQGIFDFLSDSDAWAVRGCGEEAEDMVEGCVRGGWSRERRIRYTVFFLVSNKIYLKK